MPNVENVVPLSVIGKEHSGHSGSENIRVAAIIGAIAPYTNRLYDSIGKLTEIDLHVLACTKREPHRGWHVPPPQHYHFNVLSGLQFHLSDSSHLYINPSVLSELWRLKPDLIIFDGFSPTMMAAGWYAIATGTPFGVMTDGNWETDPGRHSFLHRWMRRLMIPRANFGVGAGSGSFDLFASYGLKQKNYTTLPITPAWDGPDIWNAFIERPYDLLFCGALDKGRKGLDYFANIVVACKSRHPNLTVRIVGEGADREWLEDIFTINNVDARFDGHLEADQLAKVYSSAKLFLFPTRADPWGLVVNEALQCGTVVIGSPHAASSRELVGRFDAGLVLPLDTENWADAVLRLLASPQQWTRLQANHHKAMAWFSLDKAVENIRSEFVKRVSS